MKRRRPPAYYEVAGINLEREMERLRRLAAFDGTELARRRPELRIRRATRRPNRVGFAVPAHWRVSVTAYPGIRPGDALETLLHELVHLAVGRGEGSRPWHGNEFRSHLRTAMREAYGVTGINPPASLHGAYADAIERRRARAAAVGAGQLELDVAA